MQPLQRAMATGRNIPVFSWKPQTIILAENQYTLESCFAVRATRSMSVRGVAKKALGHRHEDEEMSGAMSLAFPQSLNDCHEASQDP
jgi:hypothetical protein